MKNPIPALSVVFALGACSTSAPITYDPDAIETLGRIAGRKDTGALQRQRNVEGIPIFAAGVLITLPSGPPSPSVPIYEYRVALEDGREVLVYTAYAMHPLGGCVKVFESKRPDYPRLINYAGCK